MTPFIEPFYDPRDMCICVPANTPMQEVLDTAAADNLTYPLVYDPALTVLETIQRFPFSSESFSVGPQADNILGLNIVLDGQRLKVGGRTVKNCTGFDLVRFICNSTTQITEVSDVVLRLRPRKDQTRWVHCGGDTDPLMAFRSELLLSPWSYEFAALDMSMDQNGLSLTLGYHFMNDQETLYADYLKQAASQFNLTIEAIDTPLRTPGAPIHYKTTMSDLIPRAQTWIAEHGGTASGFCGNGYGLYTPESDSFPAATEHAALSELGGHLRTPDFTPKPSPVFERLAQQLSTQLSKAGA